MKTILGLITEISNDGITINIRPAHGGLVIKMETSNYGSSHEILREEIANIPDVDKDNMLIIILEIMKRVLLEGK